MTDTTTRIIVDRARDPWTVEQAATTNDGALLRYRHEMGFEVAVLTDRPLGELHDRELVRLLEDARRRPPRTAPSLSTTMGAGAEAA